MEQVKNQLNMKQYFKDFISTYKEWNMQSCANEDQFIAEYLKDHPLPLPTDEEIEEAANKAASRSFESGLFCYYIAGAKWMRNQIQKS
jgi:hypothetical protein